MSEVDPRDRNTSTNLSASARQRLEGVQTTDPDALLASARRSILGRALLLSVLAHAAIIGLTSFALYADWREYGVKLPHTIKQLKQERREEEERKKREAAEAEAAKERAAAEAEDSKSTSNGEESTDKPPSGETPTPKEFDPLDPLDKFEFDENDLGL